MPNRSARTWYRRAANAVSAGVAAVALLASPGGATAITGTVGYTALAPDAFVLGADMPTAANTGPAAGGYNPALATINGDYTVPANTTITNTTFNGAVTLSSGSVLRGCLIRGRNNGSYYGAGSLLTFPAGAAVPAVVEFSDVGQTGIGHYGMNCVKFNGPGRLYRCNLHDGADYIKVNGWGSTPAGCGILGNYCHAYSFHDDDADQANSNPPSHSHNDGVQFNGSGNMNNCLIQGNLLDMHHSTISSTVTPTTLHGAGVTFSMANGITGIQVIDNWSSGGDVFVQANQNVNGQVKDTAIEVSGNRVAFNQYGYNGSGTPSHQIRYVASIFGSFIGETTNYFSSEPPQPGVPTTGVADGQMFVVGTNSKSGVRRD